MPYQKLFFVRLKVLVLLLLLNACAANVDAPVVAPGEKPEPTRKIKEQNVEQKKAAPQTPGYHVVVKGDTLYSIAWNYGLDYRDIAVWNGVADSYVIYPGQKIRLNTPPDIKAMPLKPGPIVRKKPILPQKPVEKPEQPSTKSKSGNEQEKSLSAGPIKWLWPTQGKLVKSDTPTSKKGIDIAGSIGQRINAAANGEIVYSGGGLLGYGRLIIVKHNNTFLSAYAHNSKLLVKEGDHVTAGQMIAQMGQTNNGRTLLYFEIRKNGKPINPLDYLPRR